MIFPGKRRRQRKFDEVWKILHRMKLSCPFDAVAAAAAAAAIAYDASDAVAAVAVAAVVAVAAAAAAAHNHKKGTKFLK